MNVKAFSQDAFAFILTAIADEGRIVQSFAFLLHEIWTIRIAETAEFTVPLFVVRTMRTDVPLGALHFESTPIGHSIRGSFIGLDSMSFYFSCYCSDGSR